MPTTGPGDPEHGGEILPWAREISRATRQAMGRRSSDLVPIGSSAGTRYRLRKKSRPSELWRPVPFFVAPSPPPDDDEDHSGETGWVQCLGTGTLLNVADPANPTDIIHINGMDAPFQLNFDETAEQYVWLEVDISALPATPTAIIDKGQDWNGEDGNFFPSEVEWDTDDGTPTGSADTPPDSRSQVTLYVPLARTYDITANPFAPYDPPGYMLTNTIKLTQLVTTNLRLYRDCSLGNDVILAMPWHAAIPG